MSNKLSPWAIVGIAVGGVAVVAAGVVVASKILNKKKKQGNEQKNRTYPELSDEELESLLPTPENLKAIRAEKETANQ